MRFPLILALAFTLLIAETFTPTTMQYGCRSIAAYEKADAARGYGAQQVFLESGCAYLEGIGLTIAQSSGAYLRVCNVHSDKECYWTPDTRP